MSFLQAMRDGMRVPWKRIAAILLIAAMIIGVFSASYIAGSWRMVLTMAGSGVVVVALVWAINVLASESR